MVLTTCAKPRGQTRVKPTSISTGRLADLCQTNLHIGIGRTVCQIEKDALLVRIQDQVRTCGEDSGPGEDLW